MQIWLFDVLVADDAVFIIGMFDAVGVNSGYVPDPVDKTSNKARTAAHEACQLR